MEQISFDDFLKVDLRVRLDLILVGLMTNPACTA